MALYKLEGKRPKVPESGRFWVAPTAVVIGDVEIGEDASIWFGTIVRGDNEPVKIGGRTNIQESSVLHTDPGFPLVIGPDCTVGHMVMLHGCAIGERCLIGIGAILLNGVTIGGECVIGAGTLLPEGKIIPPRSLVLGAPGKVVRELSAEEALKFQGAAGRYVKNWRRFAEGLEPLE